jgi:hypothetical protein
MQQEAMPRAWLAGGLGRFVVASRGAQQELKPGACDLMPGD